jgi:hypothetical protein
VSQSNEKNEDMLGSELSKINSYFDYIVEVVEAYRLNTERQVIEDYRQSNVICSQIEEVLQDSIT